MKVLLLSFLFLLGACPSTSEAPSVPAQAAASTARPRPKPSGPPQADREAAARRRAAGATVTPEVRAAWAKAACEAGCSERQALIARSLARVADFGGVERGGAPAGLRVLRLRAYSPFLACGLLPGDLVTLAGDKQVKALDDLPFIIRACTVGEGLRVERGGKPQVIRGRSTVQAAQESGAGVPAGARTEKIPPGTRDLP